MNITLWDGETYIQKYGYFCSLNCAGTYANRAVEAFEEDKQLTRIEGRSPRSLPSFIYTGTRPRAMSRCIYKKEEQRYGPQGKLLFAYLVE